jgi:putative addiction module CopG family antidote
MKQCIIIGMNITLTPDSEQYLRDQLAAGRFPSADAAVSEALRRMRDYDRKMDELRRDGVIGIEQADQGLAVEFNEATIERVKAKARA